MTTQVGEIPIVFGTATVPKCIPPTDPSVCWAGFHPGSTVLPRGHQVKPGAFKLLCDIVFDRDVAVKLRDGTTIYTDIFRPNSTAKCPAIVAWSPYGKDPNGESGKALDKMPFRFGVPQGSLSGLQKWEGPDPADWVQHGYAIVQPDPRGVYKSEGNIHTWSSQEGRDGADLVDAIGEMEWCSGKVGLSGNSWLAISQWFIAAERPKHLCCIAPWEGFGDVFTDLLMLGGVPTHGGMRFARELLSKFVGEGSVENACDMLLAHKYGPYHEDKRAKIENIDVPAYVVASYSNPLHAYGTFQAYDQLKVPKWLRIHDTNEWPDYYDPINATDLKRFFDYYLKGSQNSWPQTPPLRAQIIDTSIPLVSQNPSLTSSAWPPPEAKPLRLYLDTSFPSHNHLLLRARPSTPTDLPFTPTSQLTFTHKFESETTLCGPLDLSIRLKLSSARPWPNAALYVSLYKLLPNGVIGNQLNIPFIKTYQTSLIRLVHWTGLVSNTKLINYTGPTGRGSLIRKTIVNEKMEDGKAIVSVMPKMVPIGMVFHAGESLVLKISARDEGVYIRPGGQQTLTKEEFDKKVNVYEEVVEGRKVLKNGQVGDVSLLCGGAGEDCSWLEVLTV